jgi:hypothetical protein
MYSVYMNTELHRDNVIQDCEVLWSYSGWSCTALSYSTFLHHFLMILNFLMILKFLIVHRLNIRIVCARSQFNLCGISLCGLMRRS